MKGLLISSVMEWCDEYFLGQIRMNSCASEGLDPYCGSTFLKPIVEGGGGVKDFSGISLSYLPMAPKLRTVHARGRGKMDPNWVVKNV